MCIKEFTSSRIIQKNVRELQILDHLTWRLQILAFVVECKRISSKLTGKSWRRRESNQQQQVYKVTKTMLSNKQKSSYNYLDQLESIRRNKQRRVEKLSWKDYVMPEMASKMQQVDCIRALSQYGKYEKDFSADTSENSQTTCSDKQRIDVLTHQNNNLKEELHYLRQTLIKLLEHKSK